MDADEQLAREAIRKTLGACTQAGDARKAAAYAACFTEDGVLELDVRHAGRDGIFRFMTAPSPIPQPGAEQQSPGFVSHHLTTCRIELTTPVSAKVKTYWLVITAAGLDHSGYYDDVFRRDGEAWLIEYRRPRTLWVSETSLLVARPGA